MPIDVPVMAMLACQKISETILSGTPAVSITEAAECRNVCNPFVDGNPARFTATLSARKALRGSGAHRARS